MINKFIWDQVKVTPLLKSTIVLKRGIPQGLIGVTPIGLQETPNSIEGEIEASKKAQKIAKKNIASLKTKRKKLNFSESTK